MVERVQRRAARFILSNYKSTESVREMLRLLGLPSLAKRRHLARLQFFFLLSKHKFNLDTTQYVSPRRTRSLIGVNEYTYDVPQQRIKQYANSFFPKTREWNSLPPALLRSVTAEDFEEGLRKYFVESEL